MGFPSIRKYWILFISMSAMLVSSFATSETLMTFEMLSDSGSKQAHCGMAMNMSPALTDSSIPSDHCETSEEMVHNCCSVMCATVFAPIPRIDNPLLISTQLALIHSDVQGQVITRLSSLYRPPIA